MILRMRNSQRSRKLNTVQQAARILLKQKALKIGDFRGMPQSALGAGGRVFKSSDAGFP